MAHPQKNTKPAKSAVAEGVVRSSETNTSRQFFVCNFILSSNSDDTTEELLVECVNIYLLHSRQGPRFAAVQ